MLFWRAGFWRRWPGVRWVVVSLRSWLHCVVERGEKKTKWFASTRRSEPKTRRSVRRSKLTHSTDHTITMEPPPAVPLHLTSLAILSPTNAPLYVHAFTGKTDELRSYHLAHAAVDVIEERSGWGETR